MRAGPGPSAAPGLNLETFCEERIPASAQSNARRSWVRGRWSDCEMRLWPGLKRCWEDRRWLLVMLSGLQQPDDRSSQSVGSSSYSADSGYTGGERVSCGDACRLVLIKWSGGSQGQTGNTAVIRSEAASDPWYPLILGHSRVFTWAAQISRWRVSGEEQHDIYKHKPGKNRPNISGQYHNWIPFNTPGGWKKEEGLRWLKYCGIL